MYTCWARPNVPLTRRVYNFMAKSILSHYLSKREDRATYTLYEAGKWSTTHPIDRIVECRTIVIRRLACRLKLYRNRGEDIPNYVIPYA